MILILEAECRILDCYSLGWVVAEWVVQKVVALGIAREIVPGHLFVVPCRHLKIGKIFKFYRINLPKKQTNSISHLCRTLTKTKNCQHCCKCPAVLGCKLSKQEIVQK
jgi:hypothetical protein